MRKPDLTYRLTKYASFHAGYRRRLGQYDFTIRWCRMQRSKTTTSASTTTGRCRSARRARTTLNFATGSSIYKDFDGRHYSATGSANLDHRFGRTGHLGLVYSRGVGLLEGLLAPVFTDSRDRDGRKRVVSTGAGVVVGRLCLRHRRKIRQRGPGTATAPGPAPDSSSVGLTPRSALQAGYNYYQHDVGDAVQLLGRLPNHAAPADALRRPDVRAAAGSASESGQGGSSVLPGKQYTVEDVLHSGLALALADRPAVARRGGDDVRRRADGCPTCTARKA